MVQVVIDNYIKVAGLPEFALNQITYRLTYVNPAYEQAKKFQRFKVIRRIPKTLEGFAIFDKWLYLPRGFFLEFILFLANNGIDYEIIDKRVQYERILIEPQVKMRSYQEQMINDLLGYPGLSCLLKSAPGTGKTHAGLEFARREQRKTLWITHTGELIDQTRKAAAWALGIPEKEVGLIGQGKIVIGDFITLATIQTLYRKREEFRKYKYEWGTLVVDEVHHKAAKSWFVGSHIFAPIFTLGLTATDRRNDGLTKMMLDAIGPVATTPDKQMLIDEGVLITPEMWVINTNLAYFGETYNDILKYLTSDPIRNNLILTIVNEILENPKHVVMVLSARVKHVEILHALIKDSVQLTGTMTKTARGISKELLEQQNTRAITATTSLLAEGFDYPPLTHLILATPFRNTVLFEQMVGRLQRIYEGKDTAVIIDLVDKNQLLFRQAEQRIAMAKGLGLAVITKVNYR